MPLHLPKFPRSLDPAQPHLAPIMAFTSVHSALVLYNGIYLFCRNGSPDLLGGPFESTPSNPDAAFTDPDLVNQGRCTFVFYLFVSLMEIQIGRFVVFIAEIIPRSDNKFRMFALV